MRKKTKSILASIFFASTLLAQGIFSACSRNRELLATPLPQSYRLPNSPNKVWEAALLEASKPNRQILVRDEVSHLLSWVSEVQTDASLHASLTDPRVASGHKEIIAITVVRIEPVPGGSRLTTRLTYCSGKIFLGISSSRGNYEQEVLRAIRKSLISEVTSHDKN